MSISEDQKLWKKGIQDEITLLKQRQQQKNELNHAKSQEV